MPLDVTALGSLASSLEELTTRLGLLAATCDEKDDTGNELREVERQLEGSSRRLLSVLRRATA
jgi:hypothetical protein